MGVHPEGVADTIKKKLQLGRLDVPFESPDLAPCGEEYVLFWMVVSFISYI